MIRFVSWYNSLSFPVEDSWDLSGSMSVARHQSGCAQSAVHGLVISGGCSNDDCVGPSDGSDIVERTADGVVLENLPDMPSVMYAYRHCLVDLGDGDLFTTGLYSRTVKLVRVRAPIVNRKDQQPHNESKMTITGAPSDPSLTFIYYSADGEWLQVAQMPTVQNERYWSGCGLVTRSDGRRDVVVAGGMLKSTGGASPNVDIYSVEDDTWSEGGCQLFKLLMLFLQTDKSQIRL